MDAVSVTQAAQTVIAAGSHLYSLFKVAMDRVKAAGRSEVMGDFIELQLAMMELLQRQQELVDVNMTLRDQVRSLKEELDVRQSLEVHFNAYWRRLDANTLDGPFSLQTWDEKGILLRMPYRSRNIHDGEEKIHFQVESSVCNEIISVPTLFLREHKVPSEQEIRPTE